MKKILILVILVLGLTSCKKPTETEQIETLNETQKDTIDETESEKETFKETKEESKEETLTETVSETEEETYDEDLIPQTELSDIKLYRFVNKENPNDDYYDISIEEGEVIHIRHTSHPHEEDKTIEEQLQFQEEFNNTIFGAFKGIEAETFEDDGKIIVTINYFPEIIRELDSEHKPDDNKSNEDLDFMERFYRIGTSDFEELKAFLSENYIEEN